MSAAIAMPGNTGATYLTHFFGSGLSDDTYVVERFKALVDGDIRRCADEAPTAKGRGRRKTRAPTATREAVQALRPERTEIIVCTGVKTRGGVQFWGSVATGLLCDRKQKG